MLFHLPNGKLTTTASLRNTFWEAAYFQMDLPVKQLVSIAPLCICMFMPKWLRASKVSMPACITAMRIIFFPIFLKGKGKPAGKGASLSRISVPHVPVTSLLMLAAVLCISWPDPDM